MKKTSLPHILVSISSIVSIIAVFLPYLNDYSVFYILKELFSFSKASDSILDGLGDSVAVIASVFGAIVILLVISLIFALFMKAIPTVIFSALSFIYLLILNNGFSSNYVAGYGNTVLLISTALTFVFAIWLLCAKHILKKTNK